MPNHVTNKLSFDGDQDRIKQLIDFITTEDDTDFVDFNRLIPMPKDVEITCGSHTNRGLKVYEGVVRLYSKGENIDDEDLFNIPEDFENECFSKQSEVDRETFELGKKAFQNKIKYGAATWYDWSIENWGTKWNAYNCNLSEDNTLYFQTAWSAPHPILQAVTEKFPDISITHEWADEDLGQNCGRKEYSDGECIETFYPEDSESFEFACDIWGFDPNEFEQSL